MIARFAAVLLLVTIGCKSAKPPPTPIDPKALTRVLYEGNSGGVALRIVAKPVLHVPSTGGPWGWLCGLFGCPDWWEIQVVLNVYPLGSITETKLWGSSDVEPDQVASTIRAIELLSCHDGASNRHVFGVKPEAGRSVQGWYPVYAIEGIAWSSDPVYEGADCASALAKMPSPTKNLEEMAPLLPDQVCALVAPAGTLKKYCPLHAR
jgi:hypothetical protein